MQAHIDFPAAEGQRLRLVFGAPRQVLRADHPATVADLLGAAEAAAMTGCWVLGWVAYEAAPAFDAALQVRLPAAGQPLAWFAIYDPAQVKSGDPEPQAALPDFFCKSWRAADDEASCAVKVAQIRQGIANGDYYQVNLTTRLSSQFAGEPLALFDALRQSQPGAYAAYLDWGDGQVLSVSPELFFRREGRTVVTRPMKGTAPRHADPATDQAAADHLKHSPKERAENLMIVDLLRNDLARIAETGSVRVDGLFEVEPWPSVWQMTSTISATAREGVDLTGIFGALFPCGSVTGAPKVAAMAEIAQLENVSRGVYCGAIGVLKPDGDAVFSVGIRTVEVASGRASCGLGSAITIDSSAAGEYAEWMAKRRFLYRAAAPFEVLETLRLENGGYVRRDRHLDRLRESAAWFGFSLSEPALCDALDKTAAGVDPAGCYRVRLLLARDGRVRCEAFPLDVPPADLLVRLADQPIVGAPEFLRHKTTDRSAYEAFADLPAGVFDTLLFNAQGELTEFTRGSVFLDVDGVLLTPPLSCGLLPGVLRAELLASGRAKEAVLTRADLSRGRALWFGNSLRGLLPVRLI